MRCSLVIPAYNAKDTIATCLGSALNQSLMRDEYEVIVVDDGSIDNTSDIIERYPVKLIRQQNQGPAVARNRGASEAVGDILVFTDSDCELDYNFLNNITAPIMNDMQIVGVQGSYKTKQKEFMARFGQIEIETRYRRMAKGKYIDFIGTYAAAYRADIFREYGGFDTGFPLASGEDTEFSYKLHRAGCKLVFVPEAFVYHQHPTKLVKYLRTKFYRGYWRIRLYKKHPEKAIKDSYTTQSLKVQVLLVPFCFFFGVLSLFNHMWMVMLFFGLLPFLFWSIPFMKLFRKRKYSQGYFIPIVLILRAASLICGMLSGVLNELKIAWIPSASNSIQ